MIKILLVEDDKSIISSLTVFLQGENCLVDSVDGQAGALEKINTDSFDIVLLDISLSDGNGFAICSAIKKQTNIPVIFLTACDDEYSVVTGLELGADDYISKPFRPRELLARIHTVLRRFNENAVKNEVLTCKDISVDTRKATVKKKDTELHLSALEYRLLLIFLQNQGVVFSRRKLLELIWDASGEFINDNTLTVYMKRLRDKIEDDPQNPKILVTVRGLGYKVVE
jgi:DNA-binding response OmpR family regulator